MASWGQAGAARRAAIGVGGAVAVAAVGVIAWWVSRDVPVVEPAPGSTLMTPEAVPVPAPDPVAVVPAVPAAPSFDVVRIEADGAAQVAGRGAPGARVVLQVDGAPVAEAMVAGDGAFAALFTLAPNPAPSLLSLIMLMPDGAAVPGRETVALAPIAGPVVVAVPAAPPDAGTAQTQIVAAEPPAALLVTEDGVKVLQAADPVPELAGKVSIDTISYTAEGAVQFGGRGAAGQVVRLYLDNAALVEAAVAGDGQWGVTKADIAPGLYTLRADQVDREGRVTSRFETPFKRETVVALAEAVTEAAAVAEPVTEAAVAEAAVTEAVTGEAVTEAVTEAAVGEAVTEAAVAPEVVTEAAATEAAATEAAATEAAATEAAATGEAATGAVVTEAVTEAAATEKVVAKQAATAEAVAKADPGVAAAASVAPPSPDPASLAVAEPTVAAAPVAPADVAPAASTVAEPAPVAPAADPAPAAPPSPVTITVQPGLTLWAIAKAEFGSGVRYVQVYEANKDKIRDPDLIYPGQVFTVPAEP